jgi:MATE family multidrug resistance protein
MNTAFHKRHFAGPGGIADLWVIAFPMVVSTALDTAMMFINRVFLAQVDTTHMAACMAGGITTFTATTFFVGLIGYVTALAAHQYGAGQKPLCAVSATQGLILSAVAYPFMLAIIPLGLASFRWAGHDPAQIPLESTYFRILMYGTFIMLARSAIAGFFSGIGRTRIIMFGNIAALAVNTFLAWVLIFGRFGAPAMGMAGAAIALLSGETVALLILLGAYLTKANRAEFAVDASWRLDRTVMWRLLRYGSPSGLELCINLTAFTAMIFMFHGYGEKVASAVTIAFNWDMVAFVPMIGLQVAVMSLVGQSMGRGDVHGARRAAWSGLKLILFYSAAMLLLFLCVPDLLIRVFQPHPAPADFAEIARMARTMVMLMTVYLISDGFFIVFSGAIRGAGDTTWAMAASAILHWGAAINVWICTKWLRLDPVHAWSFYVLSFPVFGLVFWLRFHGGKWQRHKLAEPARPPPVLEETPEPPA